MLVRVICIAVLQAVWITVYSSTLQTFPGVPHTAQLIAFHGDQINYNIGNTVGQRWAGHLGVRYAQNSADIFGFNPSSPPSLTRAHRTDLLLNGTAYSGKVTIDNVLFEEALQSPHGFSVVFYDVPQDQCNTDDCGHHQLQQDVRASPLAHKLYAYPPSAPRAYRNLNYSACDDTWGESCFNCATYTTSLGILSVEDSGFFKTYIPTLAAQPTSHCRCYVSGEWVHSDFCARDFLPLCDYRNPAEEQIDMLTNPAPVRRIENGLFDVDVLLDGASLDELSNF